MGLLSSKLALGLTGFGLSVATISVALYLQIALNWFPCPLCIVQRYAYLLTALCFLVGLLAPLNAVRNLSVLVGVFAALGGLGVAAYHVWVLANPSVSCGVDPLQLKLNALPWVALWPDLFEADGLCTEVYPPILGLNVPQWSGLGFVGQLVLLGRLFFMRFKA